MRKYMQLAMIFVLLLNICSCYSQNFLSISKQIEKKQSKVSLNNKTTFHELRMKLFRSGKLEFLNLSQDTLYILESYDIQDGSSRGRLWNQKGKIQYEYYPKSEFEFNDNKMFTKYTIDIVQKWDTLSIREEERLYSNITPVQYIYCSRIIFGKNPVINCIKFKEFFNSKRDD